MDQKEKDWLAAENFGITFASLFVGAGAGVLASIFSCGAGLLFLPLIKSIGAGMVSGTAVFFVTARWLAKRGKKQMEKDRKRLFGGGD